MQKETMKFNNDNFSPEENFDIKKILASPLKDICDLIIHKKSESSIAIYLITPEGVKEFFVRSPAGAGVIVESLLSIMEHKEQNKQLKENSK